MLAWSTAIISWIILLPSALLYLIFYPATKTLILAGQQTWLHQVLMETKEHWGILLPVIGTTAALITQQGKDAKRWWYLLIILAILLAIMGRTIVVGARA
ncbi:MAG: hypothetical protein Q7R56_02835 [Nanoarchaeota archaeon]|nr:hypothetical protein [Nanoarchaeota archaeon]